MIWADAVPFFRVRHGSQEILLPAKDFSGALAYDPVSADSSAYGAKEPFLIDGFLQALLGPAPEESVLTQATLFSSRRSNKDRFYILERPFELVEHRLHEIHLFPKCLRQSMKRHGLIGLRLRPEGGIQIILSVRTARIDSMGNPPPPSGQK
jgi:hypothetical protein